MNVMVIGLGSMGKRRIRLIRELYPDYKVIGIDSRKDRCQEVRDLYQIGCYHQISEVEEPIDCAFICSSPLSHNLLIKECLNRGFHVFTELNLVSDGYEENLELAKSQGRTLFLSSTFLYRNEIRYITDKIDLAKRWNYIYHVGQYLPDWHPWENYKDNFLGNKLSNGCREILAIELPWIVNAFGEPEDIHAIGDKITGLDISYDDNYMVQITHKNGNKGMLIADVVSPVAVRKLEAYSENAYLSWNGTPDSLYEYDPDSKELKNIQFDEETMRVEGYRAFIIENAYKKEIEEFFEVVIKGKTPIYDFRKDKKILDLIGIIGA